jgi:hypothetical protein
MEMKISQALIVVGLLFVSSMASADLEYNKNPIGFKAQVSEYIYQSPDSFLNYNPQANLCINFLSNMADLGYSVYFSDKSGANLLKAPSFNQTVAQAMTHQYSYCLTLDKSVTSELTLDNQKSDFLYLTISKP